MSTPSVSEIAAAISSSLESVIGLRTIPYLADSFAVPVAMPAIEEVEYHGAFAGGDVVHTFTLFLLVGRASDRAGITAMEGYMSQAGPNSIRATIESDPTLGGVVSTSWVQKAGPPGQLAIGQSGAVYIHVPFVIEVHA